MRVAVTGLPYFAQRVAGSLRRAGIDARYIARPREAWRRPRRLFFLARADLIYAVGPSVRRNSPLDLLRRTGKPIVIHWVGSDVLHAKAVEATGRLSVPLVAGAVHWADAPWLTGELASLGVRAEERPLPMPIATGEPAPVPPEHRVLLYVPRGGHHAYDTTATLEVVEALPDVAFTVVGGYVPARSYGNLRMGGYVQDMASVYRQHSIYMRLTHHDGLAHSVIEALSFGRQVVWTYPLQGVTHVTNKTEAINALRTLTATSPSLNKAGLATAERYRKERTVAEVVEQLHRMAPHA